MTLTDFNYIEPHFSTFVPLKLSQANWQLILLCLFGTLLLISITVCIWQYRNAIRTLSRYTKTTVVKKSRRRISRPFSNYGSLHHFNSHQLNAWHPFAVEESYEEVEYTQFTIFLDQTTTTEIVYDAFNNNHINTDILHLILIEYCGYQERHLPTTTAIADRRQSVARKRRCIYAELACKFGCSHLLLIILISSLLFAAYCGVIFLYQNDEYFEKYSVYVECGCVRDINGLCEVRDHPYNGVDPPYNSFYNDIFEPYVADHINDQEAKNYLLHNDSTLYIQSGQKGFCSVEYSYSTEHGWLYLNDDGLSDSDFAEVDGDCICGIDGEPNACCTCCVCWAGFAIALLLLAILILMAYAAYYHTQCLDVWQETIVVSIEHLLKDIDRVIQEIYDIDAQWQLH